MPFLLVLLLCAVAVGPPAVAQTSVPDTTRSNVQVGFSLFPLWTPYQGFGVLGRVRVRGLLFSPSELLVTASPAQHLGAYGVSFFTHDPYEAPAYGLLSARYETTGREWFYGLGPASDAEHQVAVDKESVDVEARLGVYLWRRVVLAQPTLQWRYDVNRGFRNREPGAFEALDAASRQNLLFILGDAASGFPGAERRRTGLAYGLGLLLDLRDRRFTPQRGLLLSAAARRFDEGGIRFDRLSTSLYGFIPVTGTSVLALRLFAVRLRSRGDRPVPFYLLPGLDGRVDVGFPLGRFRGDDLLLASAEYRVLVLDLIGVIGLEAVIALSAASVYDDVGAQFEPRVTFERALAEGRSRYPLRPALGLGARLVSLYEDRVFFSGLVGYSAEGFGVSLSAFVQDLRLVRPVIR